MKQIKHGKKKVERVEKDKPLLFIDESDDSTQAMIILHVHNIDFSIVGVEGKFGPVLRTEERTLRGLERIKEWVEIKRLTDLALKQ